MSSLDIDVLFVEILARLPAKSLLRFKCISKFFQATISSRDFAKLCHRRQSLSTDSNSDLLIRPGGRSVICYGLNSDPLFTIVSGFHWECISVSVVGSSNGLLLIFVVDIEDSLFVINPTTQFYTRVDFPRNGDRGHIGFAYDYENLDYKIVVFSDSDHQSVGKTRTTLVYSLNTNSWTIAAEVGFPVDSMKGRRDGALVNSHLLHWMFWNASTEARIGCFDICTMTWADDVRLPSYYYDLNHNNDLIDFGVFDDNLFSSFENHDEYCFDVWVMKKHGDPDSWFMLLSIPISAELGSGIVPVAYRCRSDEILVRQRLGCRLFWYNRRNFGMSEAKFDEVQDSSKVQAYICSMSLVDIPRGKQLAT